jgi:hypothetical protein
LLKKMKLACIMMNVALAMLGAESATAAAAASAAAAAEDRSVMVSCYCVVLLRSRVTYSTSNDSTYYPQ